MSAISVRGLRKSYGANEAVSGVDFEIQHGEVFALLGPNGAGKTTTVEILEGHRERTSGEVDVLGHDPGKRERELLEKIGIVPQEGAVTPSLTVREVLDLYASVYPKRRSSDELIDLVGLGEKRTERTDSLSGGQRRRLDLAIGLVGDPDVLFLDEPTTGFDPSARRRSWSLVSDLRSLGKTILLTTHYMEEAQQLADRVAVIAGGKIVAEGTPDSIGGRDHGRARVAFELPAELTAADLPLPSGVAPEPANGRVRFETDTPTADLAPLLAWAAERGVELGGLEVSRPTLEDVYIQLTDTPAEVAAASEEAA